MFTKPLPPSGGRGFLLAGGMITIFVGCGRFARRADRTEFFFTKFAILVRFLPRVACLRQGTQSGAEPAPYKNGSSPLAHKAIPGMFLRSRLAFLQTAWLSPGRLGDCHGPKSGPRNDNVTVIASKSTSLTHFILKETAMFLRSHLAIFQTAWLFFPQCDLDVRREPIK